MSETLSDLLPDHKFFDLAVGTKVKKGQVTDEISVTGLEIVRSNAAPDTKEVMQHVLQIILYEDELMSMKPKVKATWMAIKNGEVDHERVGIPVGIQKKLDDYGKEKQDGKMGSIPYHVRAAIYSNTWLGKNIRIGDKPLIYYVKSTPRNFPKTHVLALERGDDWPKDFELDWETQADKIIKSPLNNLLRGVDIDFDDLMDDYHQSGAMDFF